MTLSFDMAFLAMLLSSLYEPETAEKNIAEIIIAKQRNGALGTVKLGWKGEYTWFMDLSPRAREAAASAQA